MTKKTIVGITICLAFFFAACNNEGGGDTPKTDTSTTSSNTVKGSDSTTMQREEVEKMLKAIQDSLAALKVENEKLKTNPPKRPNVTFPTEMTPYMVAIKWMWENPNPPAQLRCLGYIINGDGAPKLRMNETAHGCVVNAIKAYREDKLEAAINWLCAGQCHNDAAQQDIRNGGQMSAQWALQTYGKDVPE